MIIFPVRLMVSVGSDGQCLNTGMPSVCVCVCVYLKRWNFNWQSVFVCDYKVQRSFISCEMIAELLH